MPAGPVGPVGPATEEDAPVGPVAPVVPVEPVGPVGPSPLNSRITIDNPVAGAATKVSVEPEAVKSVVGF